MKPVQKKTIVRFMISFLTVFLCFLVTPMSIFLAHRLSPRAYAESYYGVFLPLHEKLQKQQGKKIVLLGTSSVAFGMDEPLLEEELEHVGLDYRVVSYGLYGALGTKLMMETALPYIGEGDVVLLTPEQSAQTLSTYFSPLETYRAIESDRAILPYLASEERSQMMTSLPEFVLEKTGLLLRGGASAQGIYASASFDENVRLHKGLRKQNQMDGYWQKSEIDLSFDAYGSSFLSYIKDYDAALKRKGASFYYWFAPMNELALPKGYEEKLSSLYDELAKALPCPILDDPRLSVFAANYFFDSDFHLNDAGASLRALRLSSALKTQWDIVKGNKNPEPEMPPLPAPHYEEYFGNDQDASCFAYEEGVAGYILNGLSKEGQGKSSLIVPTHYAGKPVIALAARAFSASASLRSLRVQRNIVSLPDELFAGNKDIQELHLEETSPARIAVSWGLLREATQVKIYVPKGALQQYRLDYFWSHYASVLLEEA